MGARRYRTLKPWTLAFARATNLVLLRTSERPELNASEPAFTLRDRRAPAGPGGFPCPAPGLAGWAPRDPPLVRPGGAEAGPRRLSAPQPRLGRGHRLRRLARPLPLGGAPRPPAQH